MSYDWALTGHANKQTKSNYYLIKNKKTLFIFVLLKWIILSEPLSLDL